jgi:hypothetical protein
VVRSANDWRLSGNLVWATVSQAIALTIASSRGGKLRLAPAPRLVLQGEAALGPALPPEPDGVGVQLHVGCGLGIREERLLMEQEDQAGSLSELEADGTSPSDGLSLSEEVRWECRQVERLRTGHGMRPVAEAIVASIGDPQSLPMRETKPYSRF